MGPGDRRVVKVGDCQRNPAGGLDQLAQIAGVTHHAHDRFFVAEHYAFIGKIEDVLHRPRRHLRGTKRSRDRVDPRQAHWMPGRDGRGERSGALGLARDDPAVGTPVAEQAGENPGEQATAAHRGDDCIDLRTVFDDFIDQRAVPLP
ncbi:hypothetical protein D3C76_1358620 [compost metagenome]